MPSASTAADTKASAAEPADAIRQVVQLIDKKIRNLEKRKQKLEITRDKAKSGDELNDDQKEAIAKISIVEGNLELVREMRGQLVTIQTDMEKSWVKQQKKERRDRQLQEMDRFQSLLIVNDVLNNMGTDEVRDDFKAGNNGAVKLTEDDLNHLDELHELINPEREDGVEMADKLKSSSEHIVYLLDGKEKEVIGTTYKKLKSLTDSVYHCPYWTKSAEPEVTEQEPVDALPVENGEQIPETGTPDEFVDAQDSLTPNEQASTPIPADVTAAHPISDQQQMLNNQSAAAAGVVDDTFFAAARPRPFNEIVSSVKGSFNFLQDSEIESVPLSQQEAAHIDPAILHAQPRQMTEQSTVPQPQTYAGFASEGHQQSQTQQPTQSQAQYNQHYNQIVQEQQQALEQNLRGSDYHEPTPDAPEPIPMPNQANEGFGQETRPSKPFTMNAEATVFTSTAYQQQQQQLENDLHNTAEQHQHDDDQQDDGFQSWGGFRSNRNQGRGGGGGRGNRGGAQNGYRSNQYNNQQRYNNSGGEQRQQNFDGPRGRGGGGQGGNYRGNNRGSYQGYPPRDNYRPEGGYQGYQRGNDFNQKRGGGGGGQGGRDGAPRGGGRGGGFGQRGGGNFNSRGGGGAPRGGRQNYNQQQNVQQ